MPRQIRTIRAEGDAAVLTLTKGFEARIDAADAWLVERWNWLAMTTPGGKVYAARSTALHGVKYAVLLHRYLVGAPARFDVDHRDGDGLNCRRRNLRLCTPAQNCQNSALRSDNTSGIKGVFHNGSSFVATIQVDGVSRYLGSFDLADEAGAAYAAAAREAFGEFARVA